MSSSTMQRNPFLGVAHFRKKTGVKPRARFVTDLAEYENGDRSN